MTVAGISRWTSATPRLRPGEHGPEYVIAWPDESATGRALALTKVDVDNLMRAKAAIYAGFTVLAGRRRS